RPGRGGRLLDRFLGRGSAVQLLPGADGGARPAHHGQARQRPARPRARLVLPGHDPAHRDRRAAPVRADARGPGMTAMGGMRRLDLLREVLDHEVVDVEGTSCGMVDDIEFAAGERGPEVAALLIGPGAWTPRLP